MSRFGSLGTQYFDNSGEPLVNGLIYFYESGTTTFKNTYADINETIPNSNPVVLTASGRQPNIFFSGSAKAVLASSANVVIETRDPVGATSVAGEFASWDTNTVYSIGDIVTGSDGEYYVSILNANQGFDPTLDPTYWTQLDIIRVWNTEETYQIDDLVKGSDGIVYRGTTSNNAGNDPLSDVTGADWLPAGVKLVTKGQLLGSDGSNALPLAPGAEGTVLKIRAAQTLGLAWEPETANSLVLETRTSNTALTNADSGKLIKVTSGTFSQTFDTVSTNWNIYYQNSGTGLVTYTPGGGRTIDGLTSFIAYPGELRRIQFNGTNFTSYVINAFSYTFTTSGTFTKPPGYLFFNGLDFGGGGGGQSTNHGGGGGGCTPFSLASSLVSATETVTIAAGGAAATAGGNSTFGSLVTAYGGGGGTGGVSGGGGGGIFSAGSGSNGGAPSSAADNQGFGGGNGSTGTGAFRSVYGGGGGGTGDAGAASIYGGGGGGTTGGTSVYAGAGGATGLDGVAPAGGGGAGATTGARGELRIWGVV